MEREKGYYSSGDTEGSKNGEVLTEHGLLFKNKRNKHLATLANTKPEDSKKHVTGK